MTATRRPPYTPAQVETALVQAAERAEARRFRPAPAGSERDRLAAGVGSALRGLRHAAGLTLAEVADAAGFTTGHVSNLERGHARPTPSALALLAAALAPGDHEDTAARLEHLAGEDLTPSGRKTANRAEHLDRVRAHARRVHAAAAARRLERIERDLPPEATAEDLRAAYTAGGCEDLLPHLDAVLAHLNAGEARP
ncbi:helix-turn-helix domain-containing protein [Micrococcus luteus]|uniref:helix-turn-helix domain-containing protein n=1 Tax=Micrococcus luteus TaxID=1270 RepID=UPI0037F6DB87